MTSEMMSSGEVVNDGGLLLTLSQVRERVRRLVVSTVVGEQGAFSALVAAWKS